MQHIVHQLGVHLGALVGVKLDGGGLAHLDGRRVVPLVAEGQRLRFVVGEGRGVAVGVREVRSPVDEDHLPILGAVDVEQLRLLNLLNVEGQADLRHVRLNLGGDGGPFDAAGRGAGGHGKVDLRPLGDAGLRQQFLGLVQVLREGVLASVAQEADGDDLLHQFAVAAQQGDDVLVVDGVADRLAHVGIVEGRFGGVHADVDQDRGEHLGQADIRIAFECGSLFAAQVLRNVGVAGLHGGLQVGKFGCVLQDHALHSRNRAAPVGRVGVQRHAHAAVPRIEHVGAGAGGVIVEPRLAHILAQVGFDRGLFHDGGGGEGQHGQADLRADRLGQLEFERGGIDCGHVFLGDLADVDQQEGGRLVDVDDTAPGVSDIRRRHRIARGKRGAGVEVEGQLPHVAVVGHIPRLSQHGDQLARLAGVKGNQRLVDVAGGQQAAKLIGDSRVERDHVGQVGGENQGLLTADLAGSRFSRSGFAGCCFGCRTFARRRGGGGGCTG